ncbi:hypothetical protein ACFV8T_43235 [Streptomyces sp. NPDC059832]|uniref:hypothetical protein n=1 Tax=Streptomyces sp. NPDC059832 TaxID=3346966 RepID=UPI003664DECB
MHQYDRSGGRQASGPLSAFALFEAAETATSWLWVRSLAKALRLSVVQVPTPDLQLAANGPARPASARPTAASVDRRRSVRRP